MEEWGHNEFGQVGDGTTTHRHKPFQVFPATIVPRVVKALTGEVEKYVRVCPFGVKSLDSDRLINILPIKGLKMNETISVYVDNLSDLEARMIIRVRGILVTHLDTLH